MCACVCVSVVHVCAKFDTRTGTHSGTSRSQIAFNEQIIYRVCVLLCEHVYNLLFNAGSFVCERAHIARTRGVWQSCVCERARPDPMGSLSPRDIEWLLCVSGARACAIAAQTRLLCDDDGCCV